MQIRKTLEISVPKFNHQFTGTINSISSDKNPYIKKAKELIEENNIKAVYVKDTKIIVDGDNVIFKFRWVSEEETPEDEKNIILAYIGNKPTEYNNDYSMEAYVSINGKIYKRYIFDYEELSLDYKLTKNTIFLKNEAEELNYINSMNINFISRYSDALSKMFEKYYFPVKMDDIKIFLELDEVKLFILNEDDESLDDTAPRETLIYMYDKFNGNRFYD